MIKRFRNWLRCLITEEVNKVSVSLTQDLSKAVATLKSVENDAARSLSSEIEAFKATLETLHDEFVIRLRATRNHVSDGSPSRCIAPPEQVAADHKLRKSK